jgi:CRISPR/Cas system CMR subunit Cmr6 (Cas7 group RAMP superfamily)
VVGLCFTSAFSENELERKKDGINYYCKNYQQYSSKPHPDTPVHVPSPIFWPWVPSGFKWVVLFVTPYRGSGKFKEAVTAF